MISREMLDKPVVPMHVTDGEIERLLDRLEQRDDDRHGWGEMRVHPRMAFRRKGVVLSLEHPGHSQSILSVWTRNICKGGIGVLLGCFVHPGTRCEIEIPRNDGSRQVMLGTVRWCRLIQGVIHEAGIQFERELELEMYINVARLRDDALQPPSALSLADQEYVRRQVRELLSEIDELVELPRFNRAMTVCKKLQAYGDELHCHELSQAAADAIRSLRSTNSIARSESLLRNLQEVGSAR